MKGTRSWPGAPSWFPWAWHLVACGVLVAVPSQLVLDAPVWSLELERALHILGLGGAYLLAATLTTLSGLGASRRWRASLVASGVSLACLYLVLLVGRVYYARSILLAGSFGLVPLLLAPVFLAAFRSLALTCLVVGLAAVVTVGVVAARPPAVEEGPVVSREVINTAYHSLAAVTYERHVGSPHATGGAVEALGGRYLLASGDGRLHVLDWEGSSDSLSVETVGTRIPINSGAFRSDVGSGVFTPWFRVADLLVRERGDRLEILASHHYWKRDAGCFVLRVSVLTTSRSRLPRDGLSGDWRTMFETRPCLPLKDHARGHPFAGHQAGGRMAELDSSRILLTVGDHEFDGWKSEEALSRDPSADYGKILVLRDDGSASTFTTGHRNPQGLHVDPTGEIWSTEHGPEGGDELNRIVRGADYGWPLETYGTAYGDVEWPRAPDGEGAAGTRSPFLGWVPSIGVSNLISVRPSSFSRWVGDLLVASLKRRSLFRVETQGGEVAYVEPIPVGKRIRDVLQGPDGRIVLWTDDASIVSIRPAASVDEGALLFRSCVGCHRADEAQAPGTGPDLRGVVGREIASSDGYPYSDALRSLDGRWTRSRLDSFLADPQAFAPGTRMEGVGPLGPQEREALIDYLEGRD